MKDAVIWLYGSDEIVLAEDYEKIMSANEIDLSDSSIFRCVCMNCDSPVKWINPFNSSSYFRHPKRKKEVIDKNEDECEKRSNNRSREYIRRINNIKEQTTLGAITFNFKRIIANLHNMDDKNYRRIFLASKHWKVVKTFREIEKVSAIKTKDILNQYLDKKPNLVDDSKERVNMKGIDQYENYKKLLKENDKEKINLGEIFLVDNLLDQTSQLFQIISQNYLNWERNHNEGKQYWSDEDIDKMYPFIIRKQLKNYPRIFRMLRHENSEEMRYFILTLFLWLFYTKFIKGEKNSKEFENLPYTNHEKIKYVLAKYLYLHAEEDSFNDPDFVRKELDRTVPELERVFENNPNIETGLLDSFLVDYLTGTPVETFYKAINTTSKERREMMEKNRGYIYICTNDSLYKRGIRDETKIGKWTEEDSRKKTYKTYSADGYTFHKVWAVKNRHHAEKLAKRACKKFKINNPNGGEEWFRLSVSEIFELIDKVIKDYEKKEGYFPGVAPPSGVGF